MVLRFGACQRAEPVVSLGDDRQGASSASFVPGGEWSGDLRENPRDETTDDSREGCCEQQGPLGFCLSQEMASWLIQRL